MLSTREAAKKLGLQTRTLSRYIQAGKIPSPKTARAGGMTLHLWTEEDIERARQFLPKIANGRKTRYQKTKEKQKTPPRARSTRSASSLRAGLAPHKQRKPKKK